MQKHYIFFVIIAIGLSGIAGFFWMSSHDVYDSVPLNTKDVLAIKTHVMFGSTTVSAEVMRTAKEHARGLSGRRTLSDGEGMLFVFSEPNQHGFWMLDMHFAIDIIWLDADLRVITIKEYATPESYPDAFYPTSPAMYVLEVPGGYAQAQGIVVGSKATIEERMDM